MHLVVFNGKCNVDGGVHPGNLTNEYQEIMYFLIIKRYFWLQIWRFWVSMFKSREEWSFDVKDISLDFPNPPRENKYVSLDCLKGHLGLEIPILT